MCPHKIHYLFYIFFTANEIGFPVIQFIMIHVNLARHMHNKYLKYLHIYLTNILKSMLLKMVFIKL